MQELKVLTEAILMLTDMGNELGAALEDKKIKLMEWFKIGAPLLRLPAVLAQKDELVKDLKAWGKSEELQIALLREVQNRLDIPQEYAKLVIIETIGFFIAIESYIDALKNRNAGNDEIAAITGQRLEMLSLYLDLK